MVYFVLVEKSGQHSFNTSSLSHSYENDYHVLIYLAYVFYQTKIPTKFSQSWRFFDLSSFFPPPIPRFLLVDCFRHLSGSFPMSFLTDPLMFLVFQHLSVMNIASYSISTGTPSPQSMTYCLNVFMATSNFAAIK